MGSKVAVYRDSVTGVLTRLEPGSQLVDEAGNPITGGSGTIEVRDEGVKQADASIMDFVGTGVSVTNPSTGKVTVTISSGGDMLASVYDPTAVAGDAFLMSNMVEAPTAKVFTDTERTKLTGIETGATADQTGAEIKVAYEAQANTNAFTDAEQTKLTGIEASADVTDETNVKASLDGATIPAAVVSGTDKVLIQDTDDSNNLKTVTAQSIADLGGGGGTKVMTTLSFTFTNITALDNPDMGLSASTVNKYKVGANGSIRRIQIGVQNTRTAGTLVAKATINGVPVGATGHATIDGVNTDNDVTILASGAITFSAGDILGVELLADAAWLPITDVSSVLTIEEDT